ncbi:hypothetical protein CEXT_239601 [Caerostris extrusa]|uniref:Uncharacterized protein n=1 Tax=Caerostris extrusa TaxID=172846 RepID=A0AAV4NSQ2_CAEEX|nr:hypothetical protein CEXT_239601 [Caerostris extrusa]
MHKSKYLKEYSREGGKSRKIPFLVPAKKGRKESDVKEIAVAKPFLEVSVYNECGFEFPAPVSQIFSSM